MPATYATPPSGPTGTILAPPTFDELPPLSFPCELPQGCSNAAAWLVLYQDGGCAHERPGTLCSGHKGAVELGPPIGITLLCPSCRSALNVKGFRLLSL